MAPRTRSSTVESSEIAAMDRAEQQSPDQDTSMAVFGRDVDSYDAQGTGTQGEDATVQDWAVAETARPDFADETADGLDDTEEAVRRGAEDPQMDEPLEERIRRKAYELWESEGGPHGRAEDHWHLAAELVAEEDAHRSALLPFESGTDPAVEEESTLNNLGEFPSLSDQGEDSADPVRSTPER